MLMSEGMKPTEIQVRVRLVCRVNVDLAQNRSRKSRKNVGQLKIFNILVTLI